MHILYSKRPTITPQLGSLSGLPNATKVYANRAPIAIDHKGGLEMVDNDLTTSKNEQAPKTNKDDCDEFKTLNKGSYLPVWMVAFDNSVVDESPNH